jgi:cytochrome c-type biogenesis protein CcmH/NrfG
MGANSSQGNEGSHSEGLREKYILGVVLFITAITYLGTLRFGFAYDDEPQIRTNPFIKSWQYVPEYFVSSVWKQVFPLTSGNYYRPMFLLWTRVNYAVFGLHEMGWHLTTVLLHVLVTWLVFCVVKKLTGRFTVAWLTAIIFGVHPMHHEVVAWVSGTTESLFAAMFLAAFLAYLNSLEGAKTNWMIVSAFLYGLALLCKETAIVLPALVFVCAWISGSSQDLPDRPGLVRRFGRALMPVAFYVPMAVAYLIVRTRVLSGLGHAMSNASVSTWLLTLPSILFFYVKHWFFPVRLSEFYDLFYQTRLSLRGVVLPALVLVAIAIAVWLLRKDLGVRACGYAVACLVVPLLPALDLFVFRNGELGHDRYFYVPSVGASLLVALIIEKAFAGQPAVFGQPLRLVGAALALAAVLGFCAVQEASFWQDDYTLYSRGHEIAPLSSTALNNLGAVVIFRQEIDRAQALLEEGYREFPGDSRFVFNLGRLNYQKKQYPTSEKYAREAVRLDPISADSYILLGQILLKQDKKQEATQSIRRGVELNPYDETHHTAYGIVLEMNGDCPGASSQYSQAIALNPNDAIARRQMLACQASLAPLKSPPTNSSQP